jgi:hypothetical protein
LRKYEPNINNNSSDEDNDLEAYNMNNLNQDLPDSEHDEDKAMLNLNHEYSNIQEEDEYTYEAVSPKMRSSRDQHPLSLQVGDNEAKTKSYQNTFHASSL